MNRNKEIARSAKAINQYVDRSHRAISLTILMKSVSDASSMDHYPHSRSACRPMLSLQSQQYRSPTTRWSSLNGYLLIDASSLMQRAWIATQIADWYVDRCWWYNRNTIPVRQLDSLGVTGSIEQIETRQCRDIHRVDRQAIEQIARSSSPWSPWSQRFAAYLGVYLYRHITQALVHSTPPPTFSSSSPYGLIFELAVYLACKLLSEELLGLG